MNQRLSLLDACFPPTPSLPVYLLECLLTPEHNPADCAKELYELYCVFAAVWAFGGAMFQDQ
ncbi:hypothetical protein JOQ06_029245, partial [Pogonophryne albipinna]